ncbi:MAG: HNH endonuclease [Sphingomonadales bacterium]|nr:HNH endonuclease [Sphingomonadales bacterium]
MGMMTAANTVDHRVPVSEGGNPFPELEGLAAYCAPCHSAKTARGSEAGAVSTRKPRKGCNPDGTPLDPRHPWHTKASASVVRSGTPRRKSLGADASGPARETKIELVSLRAGQCAATDPLDDDLGDLWD